MRTKLLIALSFTLIIVGTYGAAQSQAPTLYTPLQPPPLFTPADISNSTVTMQDVNAYAAWGDGVLEAHNQAIFALQQQVAALQKQVAALQPASTSGSTMTQIAATSAVITLPASGNGGNPTVCGTTTCYAVAGTTYAYPVNLPAGKYQFVLTSTYAVNSKIDLQANGATVASGLSIPTSGTTTFSIVLSAATTQFTILIDTPPLNMASFTLTGPQ